MRNNIKGGKREMKKKEIYTQVIIKMQKDQDKVGNTVKLRRQ